MLWLKAFHVTAMVTWFAGLFYLPRLFVYHADTTDEPGLGRFEIMERRLFVLMSIGGAATLLFGIAMLVAAPGLLAMSWLRVKLALVGLLFVYHYQCLLHVRAFAGRRNTRSSRWYRLFNELPSILLLAIVILAIVKPF
ncbi:MAG: protoporphyrinogen oxidase HemJ [Steroidobacterales bacterium]